MPALVVIDRLEQGKQAVCRDCLSQELYDELVRLDLSYIFVGDDGQKIGEGRRACVCRPVAASAGQSIADHLRRHYEGASPYGEGARALATTSRRAG